MDPVLSNKPFPLLVTQVRHRQGLVQILGQTDGATAALVERYLATVREQLEGGAPPAGRSLEAGQGVVVQREGAWHRARVVGAAAEGRVEVVMVDQGGHATIPLAAVRTGVHSQLSQVRGGENRIINRKRGKKVKKC